MIQISRSIPEEYEEIDKVIKQAWLFAYVNENITVEDVEAFFQTKGNYPNSNVAKDGEKIVGVLTAIDKGDFIYLKQVYILPEYHKQGIGSDLMKVLENKTTVLIVSTDNIQAIRFYEKHGFTKVDQPDGVFAVNGKSIATVKYIREAD